MHSNTHFEPTEEKRLCYFHVSITAASPLPSFSCASFHRNEWSSVNILFSLLTLLAYEFLLLDTSSKGVSLRSNSNLFSLHYNCSWKTNFSSLTWPADFSLSRHWIDSCIFSSHHCIKLLASFTRTHTLHIWCFTNRQKCSLREQPEGARCAFNSNAHLHAAKVYQPRKLLAVHKLASLRRASTSIPFSISWYLKFV